MKMKTFYILTIALIMTILVGFGVNVVTAEENNENVEVVAISAPATVSELRAIINDLVARITALQEQIKNLSGEQKELRAELRLTQRLVIGDRGENVRLLQEFLATDPEIYPEGLITGYFGPLTARAVMRLQKKAGLEQVGNVGPKTFEVINRMLVEGAGQSGVIPPGLLKAPGMQRHLTGEFKDRDGEDKKPVKVNPLVDPVSFDIQAVHVFDEGTHTVTGKIQVPTPCHKVTADASVADSTGVALIEVEARRDLSQEVCITVVAEIEFEVDFEAEEDATITATINGKAATLVFEEEA
jgi:peptidoglycan hydrolase-like protein with peptidoglycan-binding domain